MLVWRHLEVDGIGPVGCRCVGDATSWSHGARHEARATVANNAVGKVKKRGAMVSELLSQLGSVAIVASETARLVQTWRAWPERAWQRPTYCPGWQAADAVAHLTTGGDFYAQVIASGRRGEPQLPWGLSEVAAFRTRRAAASKKLVDAGPAVLLARFEETAATLQGLLESLQEEDLTQVAWHPRGLVPLGSWVGMRLTELVIHDWDIRQPHEVDLRLSPTVLPTLLARLPDLQAQFLKQRLAGGLDGVYVLRAGDTAWGFTVQGKTVTSHDTAPATFDTCVQTEAEPFILLTVGRADTATLLQSGALTVTGDAEKGRCLCETLFRTF
ncbi:hypothetical protein NKDENANG_01023 [Candidatus Entotheonellaceae bacterium PAL068K]